LNVNTTVDMASNVVVYVDKEPPVLKGGVLVMPDGTVLDGKVPYAPEEQGSGTRVYVDGTLVGSVKRKKITDDMLLPKPSAEPSEANAKSAPLDTTAVTTSENRFSLLSYAAKLRGDAKQVKWMDLVAGDDVVGHLDGATARSLSFNVPAHNRGQAVVDVPAPNPAIAGARQPARISAVQIYVNTVPPSRPVVNVDEAPEAAQGQNTGQGGSGQGQGGGSGSDDDEL
jgi:hypothetical protein